MAPTPSPGRLDYRSSADAVGDDVRAMRRSLGTWFILTAVWVVGMGVWLVYLAGLGYVVLRLLA